MGKAGRILFVVAALFSCAATAAARAAEDPGAKSAELDRLVGDVCRKPVVLLGEDANHGGGRTLEVKAELVRRLVEECGFSAVFFESQVYDFLDLEHAFESNVATPERLADAIGGLWSTTREFDPLLAFLYAKAAGGGLRLMGLDPRLGEATALFARRRLPARLVRGLPEPRRAECETAILRNANWQYDEAHPYGPAAEAELRACADEIRAGAAKRGSAGAAAENGVMAANFSRYLEINADGGRNSWERRDRAMAENFAWARARLPGNAKVIVWCATVHAAKQLPPDSKRREPMGSYLHRALGDKAAAIGFTALSGRIGPIGRPSRELSAAPVDSLERRAFAAADGELRYLDLAQLRALGVTAARALDQTAFQAADWSTVVDGLIVLREERPAERIRPAVPRQKP